MRIYDLLKQWLPKNDVRPAVKTLRIKRLNRYCHLLGCVRCKRRFGMHTGERLLIPWSLELEDHHRFMGDLP